MGERVKALGMTIQEESEQEMTILNNTSMNSKPFFGILGRISAIPLRGAIPIVFFLLTP
jgi:hypothetical protein